jgi:hypothetical protein
MPWHTDLTPTCNGRHPETEMDDRGAILHGQSRRFECPDCGRVIRLSNDPQGDGPTRRTIRDPASTPG